MDYHIVPNNFLEEENKGSNHHNLHDWHFEAQLFGAAMVILLLPLVSSFAGNRTDNRQVLGANTEASASPVVYDSEYGYVYHQESEQQQKDVFSEIISSILSLFR